jgi:hypothetical protein
MRLVETFLEITIMNIQPTNEFPAAIRRNQQAAELAAWGTSIARSYDVATEVIDDHNERQCEAILALQRAFDTLVQYADVLNSDFLSGRDLLAQITDMASDMAGNVIRNAE